MPLANDSYLRIGALRVQHGTIAGWDEDRDGQLLTADEIDKVGWIAAV